MAFEPRPVVKTAYGLETRLMVPEDAFLVSAAVTPADLAYFPQKPLAHDEAGWGDYIRLRSESGSIPQLFLDDGKFVGYSSFFDIRTEHHALEVGWTLVAQPYRGGKANAAMKLIMLSAAFEEWGAVRVQLKCDARNQPSQHAMARMGFTYEGTLRNHTILPDGHRRQTMFFSVIAEEWGVVKSRLTAII